jgi:hypothetical protein
MIDVIVADDVYRKCKLSPIILERIRRKVMQGDSGARPRKARRKWVETVEDEGTWYVVPLQMEMPGEKIVIISSPYQTKPRKVRIHR